MCEVPPSHRVGRNYHGSKPRAREDVKMVGQIEFQAVFDERENVHQEEMKTILKSTVSDLSQDFPTVCEEISPVVVDESEVVHEVALVRESVETSEMVESSRLQSDEDVRAAARDAQKTRNARATVAKSINFDVPTNAAEAVRGTDAISEGKSATKDRSGVVRDSDVSVFFEPARRKRLVILM